MIFIAYNLYEKNEMVSANSFFLGHIMIIDQAHDNDLGYLIILQSVG